MPPSSVNSDSSRKRLLLSADRDRCYKVRFPVIPKIIHSIRPLFLSFILGNSCRTFSVRVCLFRFIPGKRRLLSLPRDRRATVAIAGFIFVYSSIRSVLSEGLSASTLTVRDGLSTLLGGCRMREITPRSSGRRLLE